MATVKVKLFSLAQVPEMSASYLAQIIESTIIAKGHCYCALSGGSSPQAMLSILARKSLPWDNVTILLVDERWSSDPSQQNLTMMNAFVKATQSPSIALISLLTNGDFESNLQQCESLAQSLPKSLDLVVLGMGLDGHTASLFPDAPEYRDTMRSEHRYVRVTPTKAPHQRISMSFNWITNADSLILYIPGRDKLDCFNNIIAASTSDSPIKELVQQVPDKLTVFSSED